MLLIWMMGCGAPDAPPPPEPLVAPSDPAAGPRIGGEPILREPVVVGGIDASEVDLAIGAQRSAIDACASGDHQGRLLVQLTISGDGLVRRATLKSTSLRHPETEHCVLDVLKQTSFPRLQTGSVAIITYPFAFPG